METQIFTKAEIDRAARLVKEGKLVAFPTETVYGLGASAFLPDAIAEIFRVKKRPGDNPLIVHIATMDQVLTVARDLPESFFLLAETFFPGPLTLIVRKNRALPPIVSGGLDTVAIRMPNHPVALALIKAAGIPLVAPSANLSGRPSSTTAGHVMSDFSGNIAAIIDGGSCHHGIESTVVDLVSFPRPTLLRPGALAKEEIEKIVALDEYRSGPKSSPGMRYRHYAPSIPVRTFADKKAFESHLEGCKKPYRISEENNPLRASTLYAHLRLAEEEGYDEVVILVENQLERALENRLEKITSAFHSS